MKIGIFGGTFNPIHIGHAIIARCALEHGDLDQLWFMVTPLNPFKEVAPAQVTDRDRLLMTQMVARRIPRCSTSAFEFDLPRPSYSVNTLRALREKFPQHEFSLIIGADNWVAFDRWKDPDEILQHHQVMVYPRLGYDMALPPSRSSRVTAIDAPIIEISSTLVRQRAAAGLDVSFLVPDDVLQYIEQNQLYQPSTLTTP
jgi:nicotinate-nucleotide adenylyltransferase